MPIRKNILVNGEVYHIYSRSIEKYVIFPLFNDFLRMEELIKYYKIPRNISFSLFSRTPDKYSTNDKGEEIVRIIAYCLMPTHIHLILQQKKENGISKFMEKVLKGYAVYFNKKYRRSGPLWSGRFSNVRVRSYEQLLHLTRYIHLNPVTSYLVEKPDDWRFSSYREYVGLKKKNLMCDWEGLIAFQKKSYIEFVNNRKDYQRELAKIKELLFSEPGSG